MFALKLPTLQSNGIQCIGERQGPARISGSAETVADDDEDDDIGDDGGDNDDGDVDVAAADFKLTPRQ